MGVGTALYAKGQDLSSVKNRYEDKNLSLDDMNALAASLGNLFGDRPVKAYVPEQSFDNGVLYINIVKKK